MPVDPGQAGLDRPAVRRAFEASKKEGIQLLDCISIFIVLNSVDTEEGDLSLYIFAGMSYRFAYTQNVSLSRGESSNGAARIG
jgi:hypothetical protein